MADQPTDIFTESAPQGDPQQSPAPQDIFSDQLKMIKNESGEQKYDSVPKALDGLANAQAYIPQLKSELQQKEAELNEMRQKLEQTASVEDVVSRLTAKQESSETPASTPQQAAQGLDETAVADLFNKLSQQQAQQSVAENNKAQVQNALTEKFGEKASEVVQAKAKELGMTPDGIRTLASQSPQAVLALFGGGASPQPTTNSINFPLQANEPAPLERPTKSVLSGATSKEQAEFMARVKEEVYRKYNIQS